jgi:hypothetical protein
VKSNTVESGPRVRTDFRPDRPRSVLGAVLVAVLLAGCGGAASPAPAPAAELSVRGRYQCVPEPAQPESLTPGDLLDVPRLSASVRELLRDSEHPRAELVLTLGFEADGLNVRRTVIAHDVTPILADSIQQLVFEALVRAPARESAWGVRLRVRAGPEVRLALEPREYCPPRPRSVEIESAVAEFMGSGVRYRGGVRERVVLIAVQVHPLGYVEGARILRGAAPGSPLERRLSDYARQFSFYPASLDGIPVRGEIAVPIRLPD